MDPKFNDLPHRRYNPLLDEWILVSPHRAKRPWQGKVETLPPGNLPSYDPECYLCPGNSRTSGTVNPKYANTFVFDNDFASLLPADPSTAEADASAQTFEARGGLIRAKLERGLCRVICFSPRHDLTLAMMDTGAIRKVIDLWVEQYLDLGSKDYISHVQIFENKGAMMGCSNPHPHGQIWANESIPSLPAKKIQSQSAYHQSHGVPLLADYLEWELGEDERIISQNEDFVLLTPFWATWPFETMILPRRAVASIDALTDSERSAWADMIRDAAVRYDNLFSTSFPYSMGINQKPVDGQEYPGLTMHQTFFPPLLRSATVRKFIVGYELSGEPQRDITPEQAAMRLRDCGGKHYLQS